MKRLQRLALPFLLALLSVSMAVPACAGKFPSDIWPALKACGSNDVNWATATQVFADLVEIVDGNPAGETDLLAMLANDVGGAIPCLVNYFESQGGAIATAATKFKAVHAKELAAAAARGPSACRAPSLEKTSNAAPPAPSSASTGVTVGGNTAQGKPGVATRPGGTFVYAGETVDHAARRCEVACRTKEAIGSPGERCLCQRKVDGLSIWVASR